MVFIFIFLKCIFGQFLLFFDIFGWVLGFFGDETEDVSDVWWNTGITRTMQGT